MAVDTKLAQRIADYLNDVLAHDRNAVTQLVSARVPCGKALRTHRTVQVMRVDDEALQQSGYYVGLMGVLNGLIGRFDDGPRQGWGALVADIDDDSGDVQRFRVLVNTESGEFASGGVVKAETPGGTITSKTDGTETGQ